MDDVTRKSPEGHIGQTSIAVSNIRQLSRMFPARHYLRAWTWRHTCVKTEGLSAITLEAANDRGIAACYLSHMVGALEILA